MPSLADEFFRLGVRNYVGTAWEVNDVGATLFAEEFYRAILHDPNGSAGGSSFGNAVLAARKALWRQRHLYGPLWAAYQHYGDPSSDVGLAAREVPLPEPLSDAALLQRFLPYLHYDSLESYRSDSAAILPEFFFDDGSEQSYTNTLKRAGGSIVAAAHPEQGQKQLDLAFLGKRYPGGGQAAATDYLDASAGATSRTRVGCTAMCATPTAPTATSCARRTGRRGSSTGSSTTTTTRTSSAPGCTRGTGR